MTPRSRQIHAHNAHDSSNSNYDHVVVPVYGAWPFPHRKLLTDTTSATGGYTNGI
jgi:hypothetical protein